MDLRAIARCLLNDSNVEPYDYQEDVFKAVLQGKTVLVHAPTGAGKTLAAVAPFLKLVLENKGGQLLYSLPLRILTHSLGETAQNWADKFGIDGFTIQTGDQSDDPMLEGRGIFCTIDQSLSGLAGFPLSLPQRMSNINLGVLYNSYLVFDEIHLFDWQRALSTIISLFKHFRPPGLPAVFMTATLSNEAEEWVKKNLKAEIIKVTPDQCKDIPSESDKQRTVYWQDAELNVHEIERLHKRKTLVIVNRVKRAQELYRELKSRKPGYNVVLIHSRFLPPDRIKKENLARRYLARDSKEKAIVITTQVVEAGLDVSADRLLTELCPANSLVQRMGRCARYPDEKGDVFVYWPGDPENPVFAPYKREHAEATLQSLKTLHGNNMDFQSAQQFVSASLANIDRKQTEKIDSGRHILEKRLFESLVEHEKRRSRELIRDIDSRQLLIAEPNIKEPFNYHAFSLSPGTLIGRFLNWEKQYEDDWLYKTIISVENGDGYTYETIEDEGEINASPFILGNPRHLTYSDDTGLLLERQQETENARLIERPRKVDKKYVKATLTYKEHIKNCLKYFDEVLLKTLNPTLPNLSSATGISVETILNTIRLVIICHDIGKAGIEWQQKAQGLEIPRVDIEKIYTHPPEKVQGKLPPHATIGGYCFCVLLRTFLKGKETDENLRELIQGGFKAISTHHGVNVEKIPAFRLASRIRHDIRELLDEFELNVEALESALPLVHETGVSKIRDLFPRPERPGFMLYSVFIRALRLADHHSFDYVNKGDLHG